MPAFLNEMVGSNSDSRACRLRPGPESCTSMPTSPSASEVRHQNDAAGAGGLRRILDQVGQDAPDQVLVGEGGGTAVEAQIVEHLGMRAAEQGNALLNQSR